MSKDINDITAEQLEKLIDKLDIDIDDIYHLILPGGMEMIGQLFPVEQIADLTDIEDSNSDLIDLTEDTVEFVNEENDLLFLNPIRVHREHFINEDGMLGHTNYFTEWNPCIDGPFTNINKNQITSINRASPEALVNYLKAIYQIYYPLLDEIPDGDLTIIDNILPKKESSIMKNVVDFKKYQTRRSRGKF